MNSGRLAAAAAHPGPRALPVDPVVAMPRRNRQKLHRELRQRAESRKREQHERRAQRREQDAKMRAAVARALKGAAPVRPRAATGVRASVLSTLEQLLRLAAVAEPLRHRVRQIAHVMGQQIPSLATTDQLPWFLLLAEPNWVRRPGAFRAPSGSIRRKRDAFAHHLLVRYPVAPFLVRALDVDPLAVARVPVEEQWSVGLLAAIGQGTSMRALVGTELMPAPLTRRMCHAFLSATAPTPPIRALRMAQVVGFGARGRLDCVWARGRLGVLRGVDPEVGEPFWHQVIGWIARRPELHGLVDRELEGILEWIEAKRRESLQRASAGFVLKGRTPASVRRDAEAWHALHARAHAARRFPASGFLPYIDGPTRIVEITNEMELRLEGDVMGHCAFAYRRLLAKGIMALFSLRHGDGREATIEVFVGRDARGGRPSSPTIVRAVRASSPLFERGRPRIVSPWTYRNGARNDWTDASAASSSSFCVRPVCLVWVLVMRKEWSPLGTTCNADAAVMRSRTSANRSSGPIASRVPLHEQYRRAEGDQYLVAHGLALTATHQRKAETDQGVDGLLDRDVAAHA